MSKKYKYTYEVRRERQVFLFPESHSLRNVFHKIDRDGVTVACITMNPSDDEMRIRFYESLEIACGIHKKMYGMEVN